MNNQDRLTMSAVAAALLTTSCHEGVDERHHGPSLHEAQAPISGAQHGYASVAANGTINFAFNSSGAAVSLDSGGWTNTGFAVVRFVDLGLGNGDHLGHPQVTAVGNDATKCNLDIFGKDGNDRLVGVRCRDHTNTPVNTAFAVQFHRATGSESGVGAYGIASMWGNGIQTRAVALDRNWNSTGSVNEVFRYETGVYDIVLPNLASPSLGGNIQVTARDKGKAHCAVAPIGEAGCNTPQSFRVRCYDEMGMEDNVRFAFNFTGAGELDIGTVGGYVWSSDPTVPFSPANFTHNGCGGTNTITRTGAGAYTVHHDGLQWDLGTPHVTAALTDNDDTSNHFCKVADWGASSSGGTDVDVRCFDDSGAPVDSTFVEKFTSSQTSCP